MFKLNLDNEAPQITIERMDEPTHCHEINTEEVVDQPWFHEVKRYLEAQEYPEGASVNDNKFLRRFSAKFFLSNGILYKRVVPQNLPSHIPQDLSRMIFKLFKISQELYSSNHLLSQLKLGFWFFKRI